MILFDLDGTLANCEHRRHFVEKNHHNNLRGIQLNDKDILLIKKDCTFELLNREDRPNWKPDWKAFYEACDKDEPIDWVVKIFNLLVFSPKSEEVHIWSGRCESVRDKTEQWLSTNTLCSAMNIPLKMRPIGDYTPDDQLKERWLDEYIISMWPKLEKDAPDGTIYHRKDPIKFVFDSDPKSVQMWRRRGIFVFKCCQHDEEF